MSDDVAAEGSRRLDYDLADTVHADTPARMKALGDHLRLTLLDLVLERAMTVTELAERVGRPRGSVAHHVDVLVDAGFLTVVRTRRVRAVEERFYGRTAMTIVLTHTPGSVPFLEQFADDVDLDALERATAGTWFTLRHARIPAERADAYLDRLYRLSLEFADEPREGDIDFGLFVALYPARTRTGRRAT